MTNTRRQTGLVVSLVLLGSMLVLAAVAPWSFRIYLGRPEYYREAKLIHVLCVTVLFSNALIGTLWETRALLSRKAELVRHTYETVVWLDSILTAPLVVGAVISGIALASMQGGIWITPWLTIGFLIFVGVGLLWVVADIPSQYRIKAGFRALSKGAERLPREMERLLYRRVVINIAGTVPLLIVFGLMVLKPDFPAVKEWLERSPAAALQRQFLQER